MQGPAANFVWEIAPEDRYELDGAGRVAFLNSYVTQDIKNLPAGGVTTAAFLTQKGKLVSEARILNLGQKFLLLFPAGFGSKVEAHLATFLLFAEASLKNCSGQYAHFALSGPRAGDLLKSLGLMAPSPAETGLVQVAWQNSEAILYPSNPFGKPGYELLVAASLAPQVRQGLREASWLPGEELERLRIEAGLPKMGVDMGEDNLVAEVGLDERATSFNKGCYLGQETTARVQSRGHVNRKLVRVRLSEAYPGPLPVELRQGEKTVGTLTSAALSPTVGGTLGLATVQLAAWEQGEGIYFPGPTGKIGVSKL